MQVVQTQFTGKQYLQMDIANNFGLDKEDWEVRLQWFESHKHCLGMMMSKAEVPAQYFAAVQAWDAVTRGEPTGYPIALDATASGMQILACLTGDRRAAMLCNVINIGRRADAYTEIYMKMLAKVGQQGRVSRDMIKEAVMTSLYNSEAIPKRVFGNGPLLVKFHETMEEECPAVWELNKYYKDMWDSTRSIYSWVLPDNFHVHCKVIDVEYSTVLFNGEHFDVGIKVNRPTQEGRSLSANTTHSIDGMIVREIGRRCNYNATMVQRVKELMEDESKWQEPVLDGINDMETSLLIELLDRYKESGYLSARILECILPWNAHMVPRADVLELIDSLPAKPFEVFSIHD